MSDHANERSSDSEFVLAPGDFRDESLAPEVDRELLMRLIRSELSEEASRAVYRLIHCFKSWRDLHAELTASHFLNNKPHLD